MKTELCWVPENHREEMKFSSYLKAVEADAPPEWRRKFVNYRLLKKKVKGLRCALLRALANALIIFEVRHPQ